MERYIPPEHRPQREGWNENTDKPDALPNLIVSALLSMRLYSYYIKKT